jgi:chromosome segregation ATPase
MGPDKGLFSILLLQKLASALESANASNKELTVSQTVLEMKEKASQKELLNTRETLTSTKKRMQEIVNEAAEEKKSLEKKVAELEEATATHKAALERASVAVRCKAEEIAQLHMMVQGGSHLSAAS